MQNYRFDKKAIVFVCTKVVRQALLFLLLSIESCAPSTFSGTKTSEACLEFQIKRLERLTEKDAICTLNGSEVSLVEFADRSSFYHPGCGLPPKFYYWKNEVKEIVSKALSRDVKHKVRIYYNLMSTCYPETIDIDRIFGDVAEFYDESGIFMGFAVYLGNGNYCPLPFSMYKGP